MRSYPIVFSGPDFMPMMVTGVRDGENDPARLVSPNARTKKTARPFFEEGDKGEAIRNALSFCEQYQGMFIKTRHIMKVIADSGLLAERTSKLTLADGQSFNITGFHLVEEVRLLSMSDEDFIKLRKADALPAIYCHLASMNS